jgi:ABC-type polysaccharide/polyol phosphate export permease
MNDSLVAEARAAVAVARASLRRSFRYPVNLVSQVLQPLMLFLLPSFLLGAAFVVNGRAVGLERATGTADLAGFLFLGIVVGNLVDVILWGTAYSVRLEMDGGTLEALWLTPTGRDTILLGRTLGVLVVFAIAQCVLLVIGTAFFGVRVAPEALLALPALALAVIGMLGVAYGAVALTFWLRDPTFFLDMANFALIYGSGATFPITVLPRLFQLVVLIFPTTLAIDLLRHFALSATTVADPLLEYGLLVLFAGVFLPLGRYAFARAEQRIRQTGGLSQY